MKNIKLLSLIVICSLLFFSLQVAYAQDTKLFDYIGGTRVSFDECNIIINHQQLPSQYYIIEIKDDQDKTIKKEQFGKTDKFTKIYKLPSDGNYRAIIYSADNKSASHRSIWATEIVVKNGLADYRYFKEVYELNEKYNSNNYQYQIERLGVINQDIYDLTQSLIKDKNTMLEKVIVLHDWITENIYYDYDAYRSDVLIEDAYRGVDTYYNKRGVCLGIAELYYIMLKSANIPVKHVNGFVFNSDEYQTYDDLLNRVKNTNHAWNEVYIAELNRWVTIDVTWDTGNIYENGEYKKGSADYAYFDMSPQLFAQTHLVNEARIFEENRFYKNKMHLYIDYDKFETLNGFISIDENGTTPIIIEGHTMLPIRAIIEEMGGRVNWEASTQTVTIFINDYTVKLQIGQINFTVMRQGEVKTKTFDYPPTIINGRTMIPVRALLESIGCYVQWQAKPDNWHLGRIDISYN